MMKRIERFFRRIALAGTGWAVDGPTPPGILGGFRRSGNGRGWRDRVLHLGIAFGWMAKGGQYDDRTFRQRTVGNTSARAHFSYAFTGRFHRAAQG